MTATTKERGILMHARSVKNIPAGRKTQTRRCDKRFPRGAVSVTLNHANGVLVAEFWTGACGTGICIAQVKCPYGQPGDRLWVRSAHYMRPDKGCAVRSADLMGWLKDDPPEHPGRPFTLDYLERHEWPKKPSIHMPRWASRITLEITDVRVERVQDISEVDAIAEGVNGGCTVCGEEAPCGCATPSPDHCDGFAWEWMDRDGEYAHGDISWYRNEWVWVLTFKVVTP